MLLVALTVARAEVTLYSSEDEDLIDLHFLGVIPVSGEDYSFGGAQIPVYQMAARDIAKARILPNYRLVIHMEDSKVGFNN